MWRAVGQIKKAYPIICLDKFLYGYPILIPKKLGQHDVMYLMCRARSTDTGNEDYERKMRIIEKCFAPKDGTQKNDENADNITNPEKNVKFVSESIEKDAKTRSDNKAIDLNDVTLQATTAKQTEEELAQKIEKIEETPLVEAGISNVGFNDQPKVLGTKESYDFYDTLANRCLNVPIKEIDTFLLNEMKTIARSIQSQVDFPEDGCSLNNTTENDYQVTDAKQNENTPLTQKIENNKLIGGHEIDEVKTELLEIPDIISPYDKQSLPFYEYINKEEVKIDEVKTEILEMPDIISPYDKQSLPFYNYINKKEVQIDEWDSDPIIETVDDIKLDKAHTAGLDIGLGPGLSLCVPRRLKVDEPQLFKESQYIHTNLIVASSDDSTHHFPHVQGILYYDEEENTVSNSAITRTLANPHESMKAANELKDETISESHLQYIAVPNTDTKDQRDSINESPILNKSIKKDINRDDQVSANTCHEVDTHVDKPLCEFTTVNSKDQRDSKEESPILDKSIHTDINRDENATSTICHKTYVDKSVSEFTGINTKDQRDLKNESRILDNDITIQLPEKSIYLDIKRDEKAISNICHKRDVDKSLPDFTINKTVLSKTTQTQTEKLPLSEILKIVRERSRTKLDDGSIIKSINLSCPPPKCPPDPPKCPPDPPPPKCPPDPPKCPPDPPPPKCPPDPPKCPPPKKDPCAKFISLIDNKIIIFCTGFKIFNYSISNIQRCINKLIVITEEVIEIIKSSVRNIDIHEDNMCLARDFEPWSPIPSWPYLKKDEKRPIVCPKDGCKLLPPVPCKEKTCTAFPKKTLYKTIFGF